MFKIVPFTFDQIQTPKIQPLQNLELLRILSGVIDTGMQMHVFDNIRAFL